MLNDFILNILASLGIGFFLSLIYMFKSRYTKSFVITLAMLPAIVAVVIMMVNGNVGAGVAVAGAFSLVRFRSVPGSAKEIGTIFLAMDAGLICGMGYLLYAIIFAGILGLVMLLLNLINLGKNKNCKDKTLRITIPEDLNYEDAFTDIFQQYTGSFDLISVKTTNMGSLFKLNYHISLKDLSKEKEFIDALRCRNGNLEIAIARQEVNVNEL
ncbi:MAG: DUF4956 domain-containing protein [Agathobacter sp.]|nr:DUF4956 domain-containing protein [Agathobacter sp.]